jgi:hypothetical protein
MNPASPATRRRHTDLQPLSTRPSTPVDPTKRNSSQSQGSPRRKSSAKLPSPSIVAARAYYLESTSPIGPVSNAAKRRRSLIQGPQVPRRYSILPSTGNLISQLEKFTFASAGDDFQPVPEGDETEHKIKTEDVDVCMSKVNECASGAGEKLQVGSSTFPCGTPQEFLRQVPFQYTHGHLRVWGYAYLGNSETADVFVNAVSLRRASLALVKEDGFQVKSKASDLVTIRARVLPRTKERKPFLIQRQFDIYELRSSIPKAQLPGVGEEGSAQHRPRRSSRHRRSSAWQAGEIQRKGSVRTLIAERLAILGHGAVPIRECFHRHPSSILLIICRHRICTSLPSGSRGIDAVWPRQKRRCH